MNEQELNQVYTTTDWGPLQALLTDPEVSEIMVNGYEHIFIEKHRQLIKVQDSFRDEEHLLQVIERIATPMGHVLNESYPILDLRLPDGSRVHIVGRPIALAGPTITIRKFSKRPMTTDDLIGFGAWSKEMVTLIETCVKARLNILIVGGTASGKTTVQNIVAGMISDEERIITIENAAELVLTQKHVVALESRPPNVKGQGEISFKQLVESAVKMRPDRIVAGEVFGGEVAPLMVAMNGGFDGTIFNMHATSTRDALARLEIMMTEGNPSLPILGVREHLAAAIDVILCQQRLRDGNRRMLSITEVTGMEGGMINMQDIFEFVQTGYEGGKIIGHFDATGNLPQFNERLEAEGIILPDDFFTPKHR
ncbi:MAG: CpaF family protein [Chitinophagaceae bacterium]|nr:CpaF family protein [Anaerolineae bacterium]